MTASKRTLMADCCHNAPHGNEIPCSFPIQNDGEVCRWCGGVAPCGGWIPATEAHLDSLYLEAMLGVESA